MEQGEAGRVDRLPTLERRAEDLCQDHGLPQPLAICQQGGETRGGQSNFGLGGGGFGRLWQGSGGLSCQPAHLVVEHLVKMGLDGLAHVLRHLCQAAGAAGELAGVEVVANVLRHGTAGRGRRDEFSLHHRRSGGGGACWGGLARARLPLGCRRHGRLRFPAFGGLPLGSAAEELSHLIPWVGIAACGRLPLALAGLREVRASSVGVIDQVADQIDQAHHGKEEQFDQCAVSDKHG
jgi:hypothetical protein